MNFPCTCGRTWNHCVFCGSKNIYVQKSNSKIRSAQLGIEVNAYACRRCMKEFDDESPCEALVKKFNPQPFKIEEPVVGTIDITTTEGQIKLTKDLYAKGYSDEQVKAKMAELGIEVVVKPIEEIAKPSVKEEPIPDSTPFSISDVIKHIQENAK